ncbi:putative U-box domain-containing protein 55 [Tetrabaena socialis]|uniref:Putative U-box domain-containing protein 55 n=1 Tax=Tetrabaena socialis TaxID=47790 RepID=A0A2J8A3U1_9CHLO|nr:putative U-box domain-containing protein 55 [Tetrabaena socialis]|eukprot:PNH07168.1 putative U-box domain-containing protein 55 [Tetrabaena socialis]
MEGFVRAVVDGCADQVAAYATECRTLLVSPLKCHPARSTAWHLAAEGRGGGGAGTGAAMLETLQRLYGAHCFPAEGLAEVLTTTNKRGQTCLHVAASRGNARAEVMLDPVVAADGFTYERAAIFRWLSAGKRTSPMTNLPFASRNLYPNNIVKSAIQDWRQQNQLPDPSVHTRQARRAGGSGLVADLNNSVGGGDGDTFLSHLRMRGL